MDEKREGVGLPSSLINDAVGSMSSNSQKATNEPVSESEKFNDMALNATRGASDSQNLFGSVDSNSIVDRASALDSFDHKEDVLNAGGLLNDTRGSTVPAIAAVDETGVVENSGPIDYIKWFSELKNTDVASAGGKGASLGEMYSNKFPVPPGFVVTAQAYHYFLKEGGLHGQIKEIIDSLDVDDTAALNEASKKIRSLIEAASFPEDLRNEVLESYKILSSEDIDEVGINKDALAILRNSQEPLFVSVRSSATTEDLADASFAGQQESFLNVKGNASLIEYIKRCFSSLYTPRAIFYRKKKGFSGALIAVVVQKMVDSEKSGVVFSRDPVKQDDNISMEAVFGLGEGIVSGKIHPDGYIVDRELEIKDIKLAEKKIAIVRTASGQNEIVKLSEERSKSQVLSRAEVKEVADYAMKLEDHYGKPQDIEFAIEANEVYIIQSRPITTLGEKKEGKELKGKVILEGLAASPGVGVGAVRVVKSMEDLVNIRKGEVLVTEMTNPDMVVSMQKSVAIVTDEGGMTSHAAIVSREMGIPAIVGTSEATKVLKDGMKVTVDGFNGKVFEGEVAESTMAEVKEALEVKAVKLKVIVDLPDYAERAAESKIDSVGLTRLEGIIASLGKHPLWYEKNGKCDEYSKLIQEGIAKIAKPFKSVWVRASDIRTDEYGSLEGAPEREINPMLGFHGVRFSLKHPDILRAELKALKEVAEFNPDKKIGLMFPQIISVEETLEAKKYFDEFRTDNMEFGVMIETPAAVQIIEELCPHVDFISFGTNDLTQYSLAVDRGEDNVQYLYNELHPAIFRQIGHVIEVCKKHNVTTSICGQAGSKKEMAEFLFKKGIDSISVNADAAYEISELINGLEKEGIKQEEVVVEEEPTASDQVSDFVVEDKLEVEEPVVEDEAPQEEIKEVFEEPEIVSEPEVEPAVEEVKEEVEVFEPSVEDTEVRREDGVVEVSGSNEDGSLLSDEERKKLKKKKKWEKFKKWKQKKKEERARKRKEREEQGENTSSGEEKSNGWGKQGEVALPDAVNQEEAKEEKAAIDNEIEMDQEQFNSEVQEQNNYNENLLNSEKVEVVAEPVGDSDRNQASVSPVDDTSRIEDVAEDLNKDAREEALEKIEERHEELDKMDVTNENLRDSEKEVREKLDEVTREDGWSEVEDKGEVKVSEGEIKNEEAHEDNEEGDSEAGSGGDGGFEDIGVYNPDEEASSGGGKQKYKYDFDDW